MKAIPLRDLSDLDIVKSEVKSGKILILKITPLAAKSIEDVKRAVSELCEFVESIGGDIARLGEERVVICPPNVKIWREKTPISSKPIPTAA
ncbi:cell division protein SepF [Candidatus Bathyarchaeota archaeon]|nr:cell division protein SepF [Candidatus Bathyarchaeota archaeon]